LPNLQAQNSRSEEPAAAAVTIAIVDSGVHAAHPHVHGVAGGVGIDDLGQSHDDYVDRLGHGTAVTAVIREKAPHARILAVKVFDRTLSATGMALVAAMRWARAARAHIVNLSLGTLNADHEHALAMEVRELTASGILVVAAAPEAARRWLPGALPGVIRVTVDMTMPRDACRARMEDDGEIVITASGYPRPIPGVPEERNLKGLSFAVANATGLVARAWPEWQSRLLPPSGR
jgi:subtilisin family serine protease